MGLHGVYRFDGSMILYNLCCSADHVFEAWFKDSAAYDEQVAAGEVLCPVCGNASVAKAPMAPRIAKSGGGGTDSDLVPEADPGPQTYTNTQAAKMLAISIRTLRNKLNEYAADGDIPPELERKSS